MRPIEDEPTLPHDDSRLFDEPGLQPGDRVAGRYTIEQQIGSGSGSIVWRAFDESLGRTIALKVLRNRAASDDDARRRFSDEAALTTRVRNPGVVAVYDTGEVDGLPWLALEHVDGPSLLEVLRAMPRGLDPRTAAAVMEQAAAALGAAHAAGVVHRDVKPANLLLSTDGHVKVSDFGAARAMTDLTTDGATEAGRGEPAGTPAYAAPERLQGRAAAAAATAAMDVCSLGIVLHECLTGRPAYPARHGASWAEPTDERPLLPPRRIRPDVPRALDEIVQNATAADPGARPANGAVLAARLAAFVAVEPVELTRQLVADVHALTAETVSRDATATQPAGPGGAALAAPPLDTPRHAARGRWALAAGALALAAIVVIGLTRLDAIGGTTPPPIGSVTADAGVPVSRVQLYDPYGSVGGAVDDMLAVVDGDPATAWSSPAYPVPLRSLGTPGFGIWIELGEPVVVESVTLALATPGVTVELLARDTAPPAASTEADWLATARVANPGTTALLDIEPLEARHWLVWFTELEPVGTTWQAVLLDVRFDLAETT